MGHGPVSVDGTAPSGGTRRLGGTPLAQAAAGPWRVLVVAALAQTTVTLVTMTYPTLAPFLQADLGLSRSQLGLLVAVIYLGQMVTSPLTGWAADRLPDRTMFALTCAFSGAIAIAIGLSPWGGATLWAALILVGVCNGTSTPVGSRAVLTAFTGAHRGLAMGIRQTGIPAGGALAALLLPPVAAAAGWQMASVVSGVCSLVVAGIALWLCTPEAPGRAPGSAGGPSLPRGYAAPLTASSPQAPAPATGPAGARWLNRRAIPVLLAIAPLSIPQFAFATFLLLYLRDNQGVPVIVGAIWLAAAQASGGVSRVLFSAASDWWFGGRRKPVIITVVALVTAAALALAALPAGTSGWITATVVILFGLSTLGWHAVYVTFLSEMAAPGTEGRTLGMMMSLSALGVIIGPPLFGLVVDYTDSYRMAWALMAAFQFVGLLLLLPVREEKRAAAALAADARAGTD